MTSAACARRVPSRTPCARKPAASPRISGDGPQRPTPLAAAGRCAMLARTTAGGGTDERWARVEGGGARIVSLEATPILLIAAYAAAVVIYIISENRRPQTAFAWMLLFFAIPALGIVIYWIFGRAHPDFGKTRKLRRQSLPVHLARTLRDAGLRHEAHLDAFAHPTRERLARLV